METIVYDNGTYIIIVLQHLSHQQTAQADPISIVRGARGYVTSYPLLELFNRV